MQVAEKTVVSMNYTLKDDDGTVIDSSEGREPLSFIAGKGMIIPGLEQALIGKNPGDEVSVSVSPEEGYGEYREEMTVQVNKDQFQGDSEITEGMQVQAHNKDGSTQILTVKEVSDDQVTLDANHPLAGQTLHFDVSIEDVREATQEELDHGHTH